jgi:hypothetical protein
LPLSGVKLTVRDQRPLTWGKEANMNLRQVIGLALMGALVLTACNPAAAPTATSAPAPTSVPDTVAAPTEPPAEPTATDVPAPTDTVEPTATTAPSDTPEATTAPEATPDVLPLDPIRVEFEAADGTALVGYYYPAAVEAAPLVVLMHMAGDEQQRWVTVGLVPWLQNRGLAGTAAEFVELYAPMPEGHSYAVFTFDFRQHGESGAGPITDFTEFLMDAQAAVEVARGLEGINPDLVALAGSSIGADAAVDACAEGCVGALSFSPGSYLGMVYSTTVQALDERDIPTFCLAAAGDFEADPTCASASGEHYHLISFEGNDHGTNLLQPEQNPEIGPVLLEWLAAWRPAES